MPAGFIPVQIIDVTSGVGAGRQNSRPDVLLVQFALNKIMAAPGGRGQLPDVSKPSVAGPIGPVAQVLAPLVVDGIFGKKTLAAIKAYQGASISNQSTLTVDGGVDPAHTILATAGGDPIGGQLNVFSKVVRFTIAKLNSDILKLYGSVLQLSQLPIEVQASIRAHS
jgi:peptidoglycan hydrolase-like protein with peptidoglycan-binding domain